MRPSRKQCQLILADRSSLNNFKTCEPEDLPVLCVTGNFRLIRPSQAAGRPRAAPWRPRGAPGIRDDNPLRFRFPSRAGRKAHDFY